MGERRNMSSPRRDEFAELLSRGFERKRIMHAMNLTVDGYKSHMKAIRRDLGWQAE